MHAIDARALTPSWQRCTMDPGRRRALIGLSAVALAAMGVQEAWAQTPRSCVLTPEAGEGPFYLDPKLIRSDISSGKPGAPLQLAMQVVRRIGGLGDLTQPVACHRRTSDPES